MWFLRIILRILFKRRLFRCKVTEKTVKFQIKVCVFSKKRRIIDNFSTKG